MLDTDYDSWRVGDLILWDDELDAQPMQITEIGTYGRVFFMEDGKECMTRITNMVRVLPDGRNQRVTD